MRSAHGSENLRVAWAVVDEPRQYEEDVIHRMEPPLNLAGNAGGAFHTTLAEARAALRSAGRDH